MNRCLCISALGLAGAFLAVVVVLVMTGLLPLWVGVVYLGASLVTFTAYAWDKSAALKGRWRTEEKTLHLLGVIGGWPGALAARQLLRHKTKKQSFVITFWATVLLNTVTLVWLLTAAGQAFLG